MIRFYLAQLDRGDIDIPKPDLTPTSIQTILQMVWGLAGAIAVIIIVIAGLQYVLSQGDPQKTAKAKNTVLYALIGLVISMLAWSIVTFVVGRVG